MNLNDDLFLKNNVAYAYADPIANEKNVIVRGGLRVTVLTDRLFRIETAENADFCDEMTQMVVNRASDAVDFSVDEDETTVKIGTARCEILLHKQKGTLLEATLDGNKLPVKNKKNLRGTCRTLDNRIGKTKLDLGVASRAGAA